LLALNKEFLLHSRFFIYFHIPGRISSLTLSSILNGKTSSNFGKMHIDG